MTIDDLGPYKDAYNRALADTKLLWQALDESEADAFLKELTEDPERSAMMLMVLLSILNELRKQDFPVEEFLREAYIP